MVVYAGRIEKNGKKQRKSLKNTLKGIIVILWKKFKADVKFARIVNGVQGFPKNYRFSKIPMASAYKQCGNSVVVPVIRRIAKNIMKVMSEKHE